MRGCILIKLILPALMWYINTKTLVFSTFKGGNNQVATQNKMFGNTKCKCDREFVQVRKNILFHSCHLSFIMTMLPENRAISSIYYILRVEPVQDFF